MKEKQNIIEIEKKMYMSVKNQLNLEKIMQLKLRALGKLYVCAAAAAAYYYFGCCLFCFHDKFIVYFR